MIKTTKQIEYLFHKKNDLLKMGSKAKATLVENLITKILLDIDLSLKMKISDYKLNLATLIKKKPFLNI